MALSISKTKAKGGRPKTNATPVLVRLQPRDLAALDAFVSTGDNPFTRPQAIRAILADWLAAHGLMSRPGHDHPEPSGPATEAVRAMDRAISEHKKTSSSKVGR